MCDFKYDRRNAPMSCPHCKALLTKSDKVNKPEVKIVKQTNSKAARYKVVNIGSGLFSVQYHKNNRWEISELILLAIWYLIKWTFQWSDKNWYIVNFYPGSHCSFWKSKVLPFSPLDQVLKLNFWFHCVERLNFCWIAKKIYQQYYQS